MLKKDYRRYDGSPDLRRITKLLVKAMDAALSIPTQSGSGIGPTRNFGTRSSRKVRTLAGNYQILWLEPRLLLPWRNRVWIQYLSHKVGRLFVPYALMTLLVASMALADRSFVYAAALGAQCLFYLLAGYGAWLDSRSAGTAPASDEQQVNWTAAPTRARTPRGARA